MTEFLEAVRDNPFMQHALLAALLVSLASGVVGTYVVVRRISYIAGGIAHCVLGGMGAAYYLQKTVPALDFLRPLHGAVVAALLAAVIIGLVSLRARQREDTVIGALEGLRSQERVVGVITHVPELAKRIECRIEVEKSPAGSSLTVVGV